ELTLPETGVCGGAGLFDEPENAEQSGGGCCAAPTTLQIGTGAPASTSGGC
ncbi:flavoprotein, partial [Streptomyces sp. NPDC058642]